MPIVTVQIGQCGNQLGAEFFSSLVQDITTKTPGAPAQDAGYLSAANERFFYVDSKDTRLAHAVMVDMEPKVIQKVIMQAKQSGLWQYNVGQQFSLKKGSGNNWAHGFHKHGPLVRSSVMELVRKEVERCDRLEGFITLLSLAGGTGSGVGAFLMYALRDAYPGTHLLNPVVWPYNSGEVCVQNYNAVLTLAHLQQVTDGIVAVENDHLHEICKRLLALKKVSFPDLNGVFTRQLAATLLPAFEGLGTTERGAYIRNPLGAVLEHLVAHPSYKVLSLRAIPQQSPNARDFSTYLWPGLLKHLRQMLVAKAMMEEGMDWSISATPSQPCFNHSVANLLVLRGSDLGQADPAAFCEPHLYADWMPRDQVVTCWSHRRPYLCNDKFAVLLSNSQMPLHTLDNVIDKAWKMFASRAYIHHYQRHGMEEEDFINSFACLEQVVSDYEMLGNSSLIG